jgi:DNA-binding CsgD family transcriptional regulator
MERARNLAPEEEREGAAVEVAKRQVLAAAIVLVLAERDEVRRIRVGSGEGSYYLRESDDAPPGVRPIDLPYHGAPEVSTAFTDSVYLGWFRREVKNAATALLLDEPYPARRRQRGESGPVYLDEDLDQQIHPGPDPLEALLDQERHRESAARLAAVLERATPRQREIVALLAAGARESRSVSEAQIARALGLAESTVRVQLHRLRARAKGL